MNKIVKIAGLGSIISSMILSSTVSFAKSKLLSPNDLIYVGAFRITHTKQEEGKTSWASNRFALNAKNNSFFFGGSPAFAVAEFRIPEIRDSDDFSALDFTGPPIQDFSDLSDRINYQTPNNNIRSIAGMELIDGKLFISTYDPYDAASSYGFDVDNMIVVDNASDLANSSVTGYFEIEGKMMASGWLSPIPQTLQVDLGGDYLSGSARWASINTRWSQGPSAYSLFKSNLLSIENGETVPTTKLQRYDVNKRLDWRLENSNTWNYEGTNLIDTENCPGFANDASLWKQECVLENDIWTEVSRGAYGVIVPGTNTYLTLGVIGGRRHGIAYKNNPINRDGGNCPGECPYDWNDWDNYIWLFDVQDLIDHKNGLTEEYDAFPYYYGAIKLPFDDADGDGRIGEIVSADYDPSTNRLYIVLGQGDLVQNKYEPNALILVYEIVLNRPNPPSDLSISTQ